MNVETSWAISDGEDIFLKNPLAIHIEALYLLLKFSVAKAGGQA